MYGFYLIYCATPQQTLIQTNLVYMSITKTISRTEFTSITDDLRDACLTHPVLVRNAESDFEVDLYKKYNIVCPNVFDYNLLCSMKIPCMFRLRLIFKDKDILQAYDRLHRFPKIAQCDNISLNQYNDKKTRSIYEIPNRST